MGVEAISRVAIGLLSVSLLELIDFVQSRSAFRIAYFSFAFLESHEVDRSLSGQL